MFYKKLKLLFISIISLSYVLVTVSGQFQVKCPLKCPLKCGLQNQSTEMSLMKTNAFHDFGCGLRIGDLAPSFVADSTKGLIHFPDDFAGKWIILFSHPADFTPVCTTEFKKLADLNEEIKALNAQLVGLSVDSSYTHKLWLQSEGLRKVDFPVIGDEGGNIARLYGFIHPNESKTQTVRAIIFIDPNHKIRALSYYPLANGRNFEEMKRLLMAMQITDKYHVATPAGWKKPGDETISKENADVDIMPE